MENKNSELFISLIYSFQMQTMMALGKLKNPITEKVETDLQTAQTTIDMLEMIQEKTKNNLSEEESKFLETIIANLKLNYVDEVNKTKNN
ncbi:MAG: DUF1844 domain-containing protein [Ignavibacteria bacterium]|nr:DUF1844 domain-containing protein [Ignavibacteria bacterium]